jgi:transcriptional regulator with XRE-family HTH domain
LPTFQAQLKRLMREKGWKRAEVARQAGVTGPAVTAWLGAKGQRLPDGAVLRRLSKRSGYGVDWLLFGEGEPLPVNLRGVVAAGVFDGVSERERLSLEPAFPSGSDFVAVAMDYGREWLQEARRQLVASDPRHHVRDLLAVASVQDEPGMVRILEGWLEKTKRTGRW